METKHQLNLPKTAFKMKARLPETEPKMVQFWQKKAIYHKVVQKNLKANRPFFSFLDGPPYANGHLHIGHALNKILKDIVVKFQNLNNKHCPFVPVWDCHGLPIELATLKKHKNLSDPQKIREHCRQEALSWVQTQKQEFERLGVLADWEQPLLTLMPKYEAEELNAFAKLAQNNLLYRGKKPVYWCQALQTAIASSEVEYRDHKSPSVYVKFPFPSPPKGWKLPEDKKLFFTIWTTTPWTLPANQAIALNPKFNYNVFDTGTEALILAEDLQQDFEKKTKIKLLKKLLSFKGLELEGQKAEHPFMDRDSLIIMGEHVTKEEGTGCVHTAPGHGLEDWQVGQKYQLPVFMPVDEKGLFTSLVPKWEGVHVFKANPLIIQCLRDRGYLLAEKEIQHSYPYNPRSSAPLIFRATDQWFVRFSAHKDGGQGLRDRALGAVQNKIQFYPSWGKQRLEAMIKTSPDWCLSRQRHWGVPIPVFYCKKCDQPLLDPKLINQIAKDFVQTKEGIEYWFSRSSKELIPKGRVCEHCQHGEFTKGQDILDVWFDSGVAHYVFEKQYGLKTFPAELYLEGSDQHRGWFQTSLNSSIGISGKSPFRALVTHCFVNDAKGHKMSKSKGNTLNLQSLLKQRGAEILRLWVSSEDYSQDLQVSQESFARVSEAYRRFRNTFRFMLGNLFDFDPQKDMVHFADMRLVDKWVLGRLAKLVQSTCVNYEQFLFHKIYQDWNVFFTNDLSSLYLDMLKDRLYTFSPKGEERRAGQTALYYLLNNLVSLMAPITSFLSEEVYQLIPGPKKESVFLCPFPTPLKEWSSPPEQERDLALFFEIRKLAYPDIEQMRKEQLIGSSLQAEVHIEAPPAKLALLREVVDDLREFLIVSKVVLEPASSWRVSVQKAKGDKCERCWNYNPTLNLERICPKCVSHL